MSSTDQATTINAGMLATGGNAILALMSDADRSLIAPQCRRVRLPRHHVLSEADESADALYFIEYGIASIIKPIPSTEQTEIALVGPETFVGAPLVVGDGRWPYRTFVQVDQLCAIRIPAEDARAAIDQSRTLERLLTRSVHAQMIQVAEGFASIAWQRLDARLARWLLMYRDRLQSDRLEVTHEFMALMVGVQRTGVTETVHELEGAGLITASRGLVVVRDADGLQRLAGRGYGTAECERSRLLPPASPPA